MSKGHHRLASADFDKELIGEVPRFPMELNHAHHQPVFRNNHSHVHSRRAHPPHFHALYAEHEAQIDIQTLEVIEGKLPRRALVMCWNGPMSTGPN